MDSKPIMITEIRYGHYIVRIFFFVAGITCLFFLPVNFWGLLTVSFFFLVLSCMSTARTLEILRDKFVVVDKYIFRKLPRRTEYFYDNIELVNYVPGRGRYISEKFWVVYSNDTSEVLGSFSSSPAEMEKAAETINYRIKILDSKRRKQQEA